MSLSNLAVPSVYALIFFLAYSSQVLLLYLEPAPPSKQELIRFNVLLVCLLICYTRSVFVDAGHIPLQLAEKEREKEKDDGEKKQQARKWCRKCRAVKPARAHHCRECKRCIPKMDHHCPWTSNCVSYTTFPHFLRFLFYAVTSMTYLSSLLWPRVTYLWSNRNLPSYLGPGILQMAHLILLCVTNSLTLFALSILLIRNLYSLLTNTTTIESWEIERHATLVRRARYFGGYLSGPDGVRIRIQKQEFPYDIGLWANVVQGMGTPNPISWFWPLAKTMGVEMGVVFETNGFEGVGVGWPPVDPDRLVRDRGVWKGREGEGEERTFLDRGRSGREIVEAFRERQNADFVRRRRPFVERLEARQRDERGDGDEGFGSEAEGEEEVREGSPSGEEGWRNREGERLRDFGLDEEVEFYDEEEDLPLSVLLARRRARIEEDAKAM